ncbi:hypothetical protein MP228_006972 [Amoeboaphelidium protococcarum]|nr:hypothetical protein MP228_006972 [Amoeboaphelidium protococcarum]
MIIDIYVLDRRKIESSDNGLQNTKADSTTYGHKLLDWWITQSLGIKCEYEINRRFDGGKPYIKCKDGTEIIAFNISHQDDLVVLTAVQCKSLLNTLRLGVDVVHLNLQSFGRDITSVEQAYQSTRPAFCESEQKSIQQLLHQHEDDKQALNLMLQLWSMKEAYLKAIGIGIGSTELSQYCMLCPVSDQPLQEYAGFNILSTRCSHDQDYLITVAYQDSESAPSEKVLQQHQVQCNDHNFFYLLNNN